jgi:hydrogenase maturation protease
VKPLVRLVVFGWGNVSRGDDGAGPLLLSRIDEARWRDAVTIEDWQLQLEHALDLEGADLALFLDAGTGTPAPFAFREIFSRRGMTHTSHALPPESVLAVYTEVTGKTPPPAFLLCVRGDSFELGDDLSEDVSERCEIAWAFLQHLDQDRSLEAWRGAAAALAAESGPSATGFTRT